MSKSRENEYKEYTKTYYSMVFKALDNEIEPLIKKYNSISDSIWKLDQYKIDDIYTDFIIIYSPDLGIKLTDIDMGKIMLEALEIGIEAAVHRAMNNLAVEIQRAERSIKQGKNLEKSKEILLPLTDDMLRMRLVMQNDVPEDALYMTYDDMAIIFLYERNINGLINRINITKTIANKENLNIYDLLKKATSNLKGLYDIRKIKNDMDGVYRLMDKTEDNFYTKTALVNYERINEVAAMVASDLYVLVPCDDIEILLVNAETIDKELIDAYLEKEKEEGHIYMIYYYDYYNKKIKLYSEDEEILKNEETNVIAFSKNRK